MLSRYAYAYKKFVKIYIKKYKKIKKINLWIFKFFEIYLKSKTKKNGGQNFQCVKGLRNSSDKETSVAFQTSNFHWNVGEGYAVWLLFSLKRSCHHLWPPPRVMYTRITPLKCPLPINKYLLRKHFFNKFLYL
jgi:hypothetical protein